MTELETQRLEIIPEHIRAMLSENELAAFLAAYDTAYTETQDDTKAQLAAWGAIRKVRSLKAANGAVTVCGWGLLFTDTDNRDLHGTYFDESTETLADYYPNAPLWYEHGQDADYGVDPIGQRTFLQVYARGIWVEHTLDPEHPLYERTLREIENGELAYSSDSIGHYVEQGFVPLTGELRTWFLAGWSVTRDPAEPALGHVTLKEFERAMKSAQRTRDASGETSKRETKVTATWDVPKTASFVVGSQTVQSHTWKIQGNKMALNPQMLTDLAAFLGVEPDPQTVLVALQQLEMDLQAMEEAGETEIPVAAGLDIAKVREMMAAGDDTSDEDVVKSLHEHVGKMLAAMAEGDDEDDEPEAKHAKRDYAAGARLLASSKSTAKKNKLPHYTGGHTPAANGKKERSYGFGAPSQVGKARKPGVRELVLDIMKRSTPDYKAQTTQTGTLGGYVMRQETREEILPMLRASLIFDKLGVKFTPMPDFATLTIPKMTIAPQARWVGMNQVVPDSDANFQTLTLYPRQIAAMSKIPLRLLDTMPDAAEASIREEIVKSIRLLMEYSYLYGTGSLTGSNVGNEPLGLANITGVTQTNIGTNGTAPQPSDFSAMKRRLEAANVELNDSAHWLYHPNVLNYMEDLTDTTGQPINEAGWKKGYEPITTTAIPTNLTLGTASGTATDAFFGRWDMMEIGMGNNIEIKVLEERFMDQLQIGILAFGYTDMVVHYPEAFQVLHGLVV